MFRFILVACLMAFLLAGQVLAQAPTVDVVYLKNGSVIRGIIIEQSPSQSLKIQTPDGNLFVYAMEEIARITKEPAARAGRQVDVKRDASAAGIEVGTLFGLSYIPDRRTRIGLPANSTDNLPSLYLMQFLNQHVGVGPKVRFYRISWSDDFDADALSATFLNVGLQSTYFLANHSMSSPYMLGYGLLNVWNASDRDADVNYAVGAGIGYQWRVGGALILRTEGRYQRWINLEEPELEYLHDFLFVVGLGTRLDGK